MNPFHHLIKPKKCSVCGRDRKSKDGELLWRSNFIWDVKPVKVKFTVCPKYRNKSLKKIILAVIQKNASR